MKILLSNDDGVFAEGIRVLAQTLSGEHRVFVSAPDSERSAVSRSMTLFSPLRARPVQLTGLPEIPAYAVSGTPVDCVRLGIGNLFEQPDIVLSGINIGPNLGTDVLYSGTVGAAHEAALLGYQSIAVSCCAYEPKHLETPARAAAWAIRYAQQHPMPFGTVFNVNTPDLPPESIRGIKAVPTGVIGYTLQYVEQKDPMGKPCYWPPRSRCTEVCAGDVDERWISEGYVTVTPLQYDLTDHRLLAGMDVSGFSL